MRKFLSKINKERIGIIITSVIAVTALVAASVAWYSANKQTDTTSMLTKSQRTANIVIAKSATDIRYMKASNATVRVPLEIDHATNPVRHDPSIAVGDTAVPVGTSAQSYLQYVSNAEVIDRFTGKGTGLTYATVPYKSTSENNEYYTPATVYIASLPVAMTGQALKVKLSGNAGNDTHKAFSVDFYSCLVTKGVAGSWTYRGKLNLADTSQSVVIYEGDIPKNTDNSYIRVYANCYFDGELADSSNNVYIKSAYLNINNINTELVFSTEKKSS